LITVICIFTSDTVSVAAFLFISLCIIVIPIVSSYLYYKKQKSLNH
jgi:hypothetical protein